MTCSVGTSEVPLAGYHMDEIIDLTDGPLRHAGISPATAAVPGFTQGHPRNHRVTSPEGRDVRLRSGRGRRSRTRAMLSLQEKMPDCVSCPTGSSIPLPATRRFRCPQVRLRSLGADSGHVPRADLDVELRRQARRLQIRERREVDPRSHPQRNHGQHPLVPISRTISRRTARSRCRRHRGPTSAG